MTTVEAIYQNGVFRPLERLELPEDTRLQISFERNQKKQHMLEWLKDADAFREQLRQKYGTFPDSAEMIAEDRRRDG